MKNKKTRRVKRVGSNLELQDSPNGLAVGNPPLSATTNHINIPASDAEIYEAIVPQSIALNPSLARSAFR
jgi:hypothetical protein